MIQRLEQASGLTRVKFLALAIVLLAASNCSKTSIEQAGAKSEQSRSCADAKAYSPLVQHRSVEGFSQVVEVALPPQEVLPGDFYIVDLDTPPWSWTDFCVDCGQAVQRGLVGITERQGLAYGCSVELTDAAIDALAATPAVVKVDLAAEATYNSHIITGITRVRSLASVSLYEPRGTRALLNALSGVESLESIRVNALLDTPRDAELSTLAHLPRLKRIALENCWALTGEFLTSFYDGNLEGLTIRGDPYHDLEELVPLSDSIIDYAERAGIDVLELSHCAVADTLRLSVSRERMAFKELTINHLVVATRGPSKDQYRSALPDTIAMSLPANLESFGFGGYLVPQEVAMSVLKEVSGVSTLAIHGLLINEQDLISVLIDSHARLTHLRLPERHLSLKGLERLLAELRNLSSISFVIARQDYDDVALARLKAMYPKVSIAVEVAS